MTRNRDYWKQRSVLLEAAQNKEAVKYCAELAREYDKAKLAIQKDVNAWYGRIAVNNEITMAEARKLLKGDELAEFKWTLQEYIKHGIEYGITGKWAKELENASAKWHISRLESLQIQMQNHVEQLYGKVGKSFGEKMRDMYAENYYRTAFEIQKGTTIGKDLMRLDTGMIETVLKKPWAADGKNFSNRIWQHRATLVNELQNGMIRNIATGLNPKKLTDYIANRMNVSKSKAGNLVMTETAFVSAASTKKVYEDMDVEKYEILATLDGKTSEICRSMDGKVFDLKDYRPGVTAEPFHARCRTTTVPFFDDEFDDIGKRAARDEEGEVYYVPADMTYKEWKKCFVDGDKSGLKEVKPDDIIELELNLQKLKAAMPPDDFSEYVKILESNPNEDIRRIYAKFGDMPSKITKTANDGNYSHSQKTIKYDMPSQSQMDKGISKYSTLAHEYGHAFDDLGEFQDLHYSEVDTLNDKVKIGSGSIPVFNRIPSSSDEFLTALRKDKEELGKTFSSVKADILSTYATAGVQDALEGFFGHRNTRLIWGHGDVYYNRKFNRWIKGFGKEKEFGQALKDLGIDASNQTKRVNACRIYETASEAWANILSAETCQGEELEAVKKYLPNAYNALLSIIGKAR